ncbi:hypothetical protein BGZ98_001438, partial [Dissophora globulifera]
DTEIESSDPQMRDATPITFKQTSRDELRSYLMSLRNRDKDQDSATLRQRFQLRCVPGMSGMLYPFPRATEAALGGLQTECHLTGAVKDPKVPDEPCKCPEYPKKPDMPKEPKEPNDPKEPKKPPPKHRTPHLDPPNDDEVDLILDLLDYIHEGRATFQSGDLEKVAGIRGRDAKDFFEKYARDFRPSHALKDEDQ